MSIIKRKEDDPKSWWYICKECDEKISGGKIHFCKRADEYAPCVTCETAHTFGDEHVMCDEYKPRRYAGGVSTPQRERELYQRAMGQTIPRNDPTQ